MRMRREYLAWMICGLICWSSAFNKLSAQTVTITPGGSTTFCKGGSVTLCAAGASSYIWNTDSTSSCITVNRSGVYAVQGTASNGSISTASVTVTVYSCSINLSKIPDVSSVKQGQSTPVNFTYTVTNTGSSFNASGSIKDDNGTPGNLADDLVICNYNSLAPGSSSTCTHTFSLNNTHTNVAIASGTNGSVSVSDTAVATVTGVSCGCNLLYPDNSNLPRSAVAFNESSVLRAFDPGPTTCGTSGDVIKLWYNDEHALTLGVRRVIVKTASGITTTDYPITPTPSIPSTVFNPIVGDTISLGDQSANDVAAGGGRPLWPALFITDLTVSGSASRAGDWQQGGTGVSPNKISGTWKAAVRTVDYTHSPVAISVTPDADPAQNHWNLGVGSDVAPGGFASLNDEGYGAECAWNINALGLKQGHTYRLQFIVHDGDQNKTGGDCGESCTSAFIPPCTLGATSILSDKNGTNISCTESSDGYAHLIVTGGHAPYTYSWSVPNTTANLDNIGAGTYGYTVTDANGCQITDSVTLKEPNVLAVSYSVSDFHGSNVSCSGSSDGFIRLAVSGGTSPYSYSWSVANRVTKILDHLTAGTYTYTVTDANGCMNSGSVTLSAPAPINAPSVLSNYNGSNVSCNGSTNGFIHLTVSGGTGPYAYSWLPGGSTLPNLDNIGAGTYTFTVTDNNGCTTSNSRTLTTPNPLNAPATLSNYNGSNVSCSGSTNGFIHLTVSGGTVPYVYSWSPGGSTSQSLDNIGAGTYSFSVTDLNGCSTSNSRTLTAPNPLNAPATLSNYNGSNVSCSGSTNGFIHLTVNGGTGPYSYSWSPGGSTTQNLDNIGAGTYTFAVTDANGCTTSNSRTLAAPNPLNAPATLSNYNGSNVSCSGSTNGFIHLTVSGGTAPYSYSWTPVGSSSPNLDNIGAGTYTFNVTDANGCSTSNSRTLTAPNPLTAPSTLSNYNGSNVSCSGSTNGFIHLNVTGGTGPYTYFWLPGKTILQNLDNIGAGTYSCAVTDVNGCATSITRTLTAPNPLSAPATLSNYNGSNVSCSGSTNGFIHLTTSGGTGPYSYSWTPGLSTSQNLDNIGAGTYSFTVTDVNGCSTSNSRTLIAPNPINAPVTLSNYNGSNVSCVGSTNGFIHLTVSGGTGPYTYSWLPGGSTTQNLDNIGAGTYAFTVTDANGCSASSSKTLTAPNPISVPVTLSNYNGSNVSCTGSTNGFIHLTVSGGTGPYTYAWMPGGRTTQNLDNIGAGTYAFTVTDVNGCTSSGSRTLAAPNPLNSPATLSNFNGNNVSCNGSTNGYINLSVSGGTAPYTYAWAPGGSTAQNLTNIGAGTYSYTVTDLNGCLSSNSVTLTAPNPLNAPSVLSNYHGSNVSCNGSTNGFIHLTVNGGTGPYTYFWSPGGNTTQNLNNIGAGTYSYIVTDTNGCTASNSVILVAPNPLNVPAVLSDYNGSNISCSGATDGFIHLSVNGGTGPYSYFWSPNGSTSQNLNNIGAGTYSYVVTDANGCRATDTMTLTTLNPINTPTVVSNYNGSNVSCQGSTNGFIHLTASGGTGPYSYAWSPGGNTSPNLNNIGAGTYACTVTDANGCFVTHSVTLIAPNPLNAPSAVSNFNGSNVSCFGSTNGYINLTVTGGTGPYTFSWSPGGNTTQNLTNIGAGTYSYIVTDANGCTTVNSETLTAPNPLNIPTVVSDYNGSGISCSGSTNGFIHLTVNGGTGPYAYFWSPGGSTSQNLNNIGAGTYSYLVTDANGCSDSNSVTLSAPEPLNVPTVVSDYNGSGVSCAGSTNGYIHLSVSGGTFPFSFSWSPGGSTSPNLNNLGAGTYTYTVTDANGCVVTNSITLTSPNPIGTVQAVSNNNGFNISCHGGTNGAINLTVNGGAGPYTYNWLPGNVTTQNLSGIGAGLYIVTVTDANGCMAIDSTDMTEPGLLTIGGTAIDALCHGVSNGSISTTTNGGVPNFSYLWSTGATSANITGIGSGTYTVIVTDANGCVSSNSFQVAQPNAVVSNINSPLLNGNYNISCNGASNGTAVAIATGGTSPYTYLWSNGQSTQSIGNLSAGVYSVTILDANGCSASNTITLIQPPPIGINAGSNQQVCGNSTVLTANNFGSGLNGTWSVQSGTATLSNVHDPHASVTGLSYGSNALQLLITDGVCIATDVITIEAFEAVAAAAGRGDSLCPKEVPSYLLHATPANPGSGIWSSPGTASAVSPSNPQSEITGLVTGDNQFIWTVTNGPCAASDAVHIYMREQRDCYSGLEMPTGYTPNDDGSNDDFDIHGIEKYPYNSFEVFNRWGNKVYVADNYINHQWKGQNTKGEALPDGTYFVILLIKNSDIKLHGYVDIRR